MEYIFKGKKGIDDLKSESPYCGEWRYFSPSINITEQEYLANPKEYAHKIKKLNNDYINELIQTGEYCKEYTLKLDLLDNPVFDNPNNTLIKEQPSESYKFILLDLNEV